MLDKIQHFNIPVVEVSGSFETLQGLLDYASKLKGIEGFIVAFEDGHKLKIKTDEYVRMHKVLDSTRFDRNIVKLILNNELDDALGALPETNALYLREFEQRLWAAVYSKESSLQALYEQAKVYTTRKEIALKFMPTVKDKTDVSFVYRMLDGNNLRQLMLDYLKNNTTTNVVWDQAAAWLGM